MNKTLKPALITIAIIILGFVGYKVLASKSAFVDQTDPKTTYLQAITAKASQEYDVIKKRTELQEETAKLEKLTEEAIKIKQSIGGTGFTN